MNSEKGLRGKGLICLKYGAGGELYSYPGLPERRANLSLVQANEPETSLETNGQN